MEPLDYLNPDLEQFETDIRNSMFPSSPFTMARANDYVFEAAPIERTGILNTSIIDDAGYTPEMYEQFSQVAKPGLNLDFARQLGSSALGFISGNPVVGLIAKGLGALGNKFGPQFVGVRGGQNLYGDSTFNTFARSTSLADFFQRQRDKKARIGAQQRGELKDLQNRIDAGEFNTGKFDMGITDRGRGKYGGDGEGGGGFADNSNASAPGGSNEMGSF